MRRLGFSAVLTALLGVLALLAGPAASAATAAAPTAAPRYPVVYSFPYGVAAETTHPGSSPPGSNNWSCKPSLAHPYPVVLVHGTFADMTDSWQALSPLLANAGYCVFALNYGGSSPANPIQATGPVAASAQQLSAFVDRVLAATGASKVDVVGHSQGGMMPRYYIRFLGGASKVHTLVGLSPSNHGTTFNGLLTLAHSFPGGDLFVGFFCPACVDQTQGSAFMQKLNAGHDTEPGVNYTVIETRYDEVVTPYTSEFLSGPNVTNILLQNHCGLDYVDHVAIIYDRIALAYTENALDPAHPVPVPCVPVYPGIGG